MSRARAKARRRGKSKIYIKPKNRGKFTKWCKAHGFSGVNSACIAKAKRTSKQAAKMAVFAQNFGKKRR